jgi:hypothetical protein
MNNKAFILEGGRRVHPDQVLVLDDENRDASTLRLAHCIQTRQTRNRSLNFLQINLDEIRGAALAPRREWSGCGKGEANAKPGAGAVT